MEQNELFERIELNPNVMAGKPVIKGTRLTVQYILHLLAHGATIDDILKLWSVPYLCLWERRSRHAMKPAKVRL